MEAWQLSCQPTNVQRPAQSHVPFPARPQPTSTPVWILWSLAVVTLSAAFYAFGNSTIAPPFFDEAYNELMPRGSHGERFPLYFAATTGANRCLFTSRLWLSSFWPSAYALRLGLAIGF